MTCDCCDDEIKGTYWRCWWKEDVGYYASLCRTCRWCKPLRRYVVMVWKEPAAPALAGVN